MVEIRQHQQNRLSLAGYLLINEIHFSHFRNQKIQPLKPKKMLNKMDKISNP